jgi:hypothetical protein
MLRNINNVYLLLYFNSKLCFMKSLNANLRHQIYIASVKALQLSLHYPPEMSNYLNMQKKTRAIPNMYCDYKLLLLSYKTFDDQIRLNEWVHLNLEQITMSHTKNSKSKLGINAMSKCLIDYIESVDWLKLSLNFFKIKCKSLFLLTLAPHWLDVTLPL